MRHIAQFTTAGGMHVGIPTVGAIIVLEAVVSPLPDQPDGAKTLVRYLIAGEAGARLAWLRDPYKHVVSKLPVSACGSWAHMTDALGNGLMFPQKSVCAYEQRSEEMIVVTIDVPTGPIDLALHATLEDLIECGAIDVDGTITPDLVAEDMEDAPPAGDQDAAGDGAAAGES